MGFHFVVSIYFRTTSLYLTISQQITQHQLFQIPQRYRFSSKSQQIPTAELDALGCFRYHKGTDFQANHNGQPYVWASNGVVLDTTKVQIFKQITTDSRMSGLQMVLFQIPQRYRFSSKSQRTSVTYSTVICCFRYHKGTDFQANHNNKYIMSPKDLVVLDTTKVQIFKQITTPCKSDILFKMLFQIPQRYRFSSKSQRINC